MTDTSSDVAIPVFEVDLGAPVGAWFTGRPSAAEQPAVGRAGNLSHRRPHEPVRLAAARRSVCERIGVDVDALHHMRQVHGASIGVIDEDTPMGAELRDVDALVTSMVGRALVVQVADCVPVLLASSEGAVAAVHAGRRGVHSGVVEAALDALASAGVPATTITGVVGPAIGGCCYEVPAELRDEIAADRPEAASETTWGTPSLDLPRAVSTTLERAGVSVVDADASCTRCDPEGRWFSHRADPDAGRQVGIVVRLAPNGDGGQDRGVQAP
ncbi:MAG: polyphenol oxidase family protein [Nitriliruptorales bacterium]|nr:polyphenol oxidase family protein [Nitriliruptorales bacterium]